MTPSNLNTLKTALHNAFNEAAPEAYGGFWQDLMGDDTASDHYDLNGSVNADRLATTILNTITAIVLDREAVRAALDDIVSGVEIDRDHGSIGQLGGRRAYYRYEPGPMRPNIRIEDDVVDRLIDSLSGGPR